MKFKKSIYIFIDFISILLIIPELNLLKFPILIPSIFSWLILNYLANKYKILGSDLKKNILEIMVSSFISIFILSIFITLINIFFLSEKLNIILDYIWLFGYSSIISIFLRLISKLLFEDFKQTYNYYYICNTLSNEDLFGNNSFFDKEDIQLNFIKSIKEINFKIKNSKSLKIKLIIDEKILNSNDIKRLVKNNIQIINIYKWLEIKKKKLVPEDSTQNKLNLKISLYESFLKRPADLLFSIILLIFTTPIILIASILVFIEDGGSIFYKQNRTGYKNKIIRIFKLRSMTTGSEKDGPKWAKLNDSRVTNVGKILRTTRIDELPQLLNVIRGDMSLIGPRPERPEIDMKLKKEIKNYDLRYLTKPGLSGWAQVNYHYGSSINDSYQKLSYDLYYLKNKNFFLDLYIFLRTIKIVFNIKGSKPKT